MSLNPVSLIDGMHKASSVLAAVAAGMLPFPHLAPISELLLILAGALGGAGAAGNLAGKK